MSDPAMMGFLILLLLVIVSGGVWYITAEHYEDLLRKQEKKHTSHKKVLTDQITALEFRLGVYENVESEKV